MKNYNYYYNKIGYITKKEENHFKISALKCLFDLDERGNLYNRPSFYAACHYHVSLCHCPDMTDVLLKRSKINS